MYRTLDKIDGSPRFAFRLGLVVCVVGLLLASNIGLTVSSAPTVNALCAIILMCFLPGIGWVGWVSDHGKDFNPLELLAVGVGLGLVVVVSIFLLSVVLGVTLTKPAYIILLDAITLTGLFLYARNNSSAKRTSPTDWRVSGVVVFVVLVLTAISVRFLHLGFAEYQGDEIEVLRQAQSVLRGERNVIFEQKKGPVQSLLTASAALLTEGFREADTRSVFSISSVMAILVTWLIGCHLFPGWTAWVAGFLLTIEGISLAFARVVQYQSVVLLMVALAFFCFSKASATSEPRQARCYLLLGPIFFAFALLAHYDAVFAFPALVYVYCRRYGFRIPQGVRGALAIGGGIGLSALALFYFPFVAFPSFQQTFAGYTEGKLKPGLYDNLAKYLDANIFYNSAYFVGFMFIALVLVVWWFSYHATTGTFHRRLPNLARLMALLPGLCLTVGLAISIVKPTLLRYGTIDLAVLYIVPVWGTLLLPTPGLNSLKAVLVWFLVPFCSYTYLLRAPGLHFYFLAPSWALLAAFGISLLWQRIQEHRLRAVAAVAGVVILLLCAYHPVLFFIRNETGFAIALPKTRSPLYPTWQAARPDIPLFGLPHRAGWKAIGVLYATGELRGNYETNGRLPRPGWYVQALPKLTDIPRYFFFDEESALLEPIDKFSKDAIEHFYELVGEVVVHGQPRLLIYQDRRSVPGPVTIKQYRVEDYEDRYDQTFTLETLKLLDRYGMPEKESLARIASYLHAAEEEKGVIGVASRELPLLFNYYYHGDMSSVPLSPAALDTQAARPEMYPHLYVLWPPVTDDESRQDILDRLQRYGETRGFHRFGNIELSLYTTRDVTLSDEPVRYLADAALDDAIALIGYRLSRSVVAAGDDLRLTLFWQTLMHTGRDYTVFVHLTSVEDASRIWAQIDQQPAGGHRPTSTWRPAETVADEYVLKLPVDLPRGRYQLTIGMYDLDTMQRLPVHSSLLANIADSLVLTPPITVN